MNKNIFVVNGASVKRNEWQKQAEENVLNHLLNTFYKWARESVDPDKCLRWVERDVCDETIPRKLQKKVVQRLRFDGWKVFVVNSDRGDRVFVKNPLRPDALTSADDD